MGTMTCDAVREALWPSPEAAPAGPEREHFEGCSACRRYFVIEARLGKRLQGIRAAEAPTMLRARVRLALRRSPWRAPLWGLAAAGAAALALIVLGPPNPAAPFAPAATHLADMPMDTTMDRAEASTWLSGELAMPLDLPEIEGAAFMAAGLIMVDGKRWAGARYEFKGMPVAYLALPMDGMEGDTTLRTARAGIWEVAIWAGPDGPRALAGQRPITREEVMTMAEDCRRNPSMTPVRS